MHQVDLNIRREAADTAVGMSANAPSSNRKTFGKRMVQPLPHHIVVVGGGAGGLELATKLGDSLGKRGRARITLVDRSRDPYLEAAAAFHRGRQPAPLAARAELSGAGPLASFPLSQRRDDRSRSRRARPSRWRRFRTKRAARSAREPRLAYDTLVIAVGSVTNDFGTPGAEEYAVPLETPEQASRFNRRLVNACLRANTQDEPIRPGQLHVAIIGAGATGHRARGRAAPHRARDRRLRARPDRSRTRLAHHPDRGGRPHPSGPAASASRMRRRTCWRSSASRCAPARACAEVLADGVRLADGEIIPSELVVWSRRREGAGLPRRYRRAGDQPHQSARRASDLADDARRSTSSPSATARPAREPGFPQPVPPRAQAAHQMARFHGPAIERPPRGPSAARRSSIAISARWSRSANTARSAA